MGLSLRLNGASFSQYFATIINYLNFGTLSLVTKSTNSGGGYNYAMQANSYANNSDYYMEAGVNGQVSSKNTQFNQVSGSLTGISLQLTNTVTASPTVAGAYGVCLYWTGTGTGNNAVYGVSLIDGTTSNITPNITTFTWTGVSALKYVRLRRRAGTMFADASADGVTWTAVHQFPTANNGILFPHMFCTALLSGATWQQPQI